MTVKDKLLTAIKSSNPNAANLLPSDFTIGLPLVLANQTKNTEVILTSVPGTGYTGAVSLKYNRRTLTELGSNLTFFDTAVFTIETLIAKINQTLNKEFTVTDFLPVTFPTVPVGDVYRVTLTASTTNYFWIGSVTVSLLQGNNNQTSNESVLFAIAELDARFDHFFEVTQVVNSIDGHSGDVTKAMLGIDLVDNTPDLNKPVSLATSTLVNTKLDKSTMYLVRSNISNQDLYLGNVVYAINNNVVDKANAGVDGKLMAIGLVSDELILSQNGVGTIQTTGILVGTFDQWFVATGMVGGLIPNKRYFLDTVSGKITPNVPSDAIAVCPIGKAISQTELSINIETIINL